MSKVKKKKLFFVTDVEGTGPDHEVHSMYQFASIPMLADGKILIGSAWNVALRSENPDDHNKETMKFLEEDQGITLASLIARPSQVSPYNAMIAFDTYIKKWMVDTGAEKAILIADNLAYDWGYTHSYFFRALKKNPFGYAGRNIPDISMALFSGSRDKWEEFRVTPHTHNALDDVTGNAEALAHMIKNHGLELN